MQTVILEVPQPEKAIVGRAEVETAVKSSAELPPATVTFWLSALLYHFCTVQLLRPLTGPQKADKVVVSISFPLSPMSSHTELGPCP